MCFRDKILYTVIARNEVTKQSQRGEIASLALAITMETLSKQQGILKLNYRLKGGYIDLQKTEQL